MHSLPTFRSLITHGRCTRFPLSALSSVASASSRPSSKFRAHRCCEEQKRVISRSRPLVSPQQLPPGQRAAILLLQLVFLKAQQEGLIHSPSWSVFSTPLNKVDFGQGLLQTHVTVSTQRTSPEIIFFFFKEKKTRPCESMGSTINGPHPFLPFSLSLIFCAFASPVAHALDSSGLKSLKHMRKSRGASTCGRRKTFGGQYTSRSKTSTAAITM